MTMFTRFIKLILILLLIFTPIAFGAVELWAFSIMELGVLVIIILAAIQGLRPSLRKAQEDRPNVVSLSNHRLRANGVEGRNQMKPQ